MVDKRQEAMLKSSVKRWNEWRNVHADVMPELSAAYLCGVDLIGANLVGADLRKADLRGANLSDTLLKDAHLEGANFFRAVLDRAELAGANLVGAQFLTCQQLIACRNWQSAVRDEKLACGASIPAERSPP